MQILITIILSLFLLTNLFVLTNSVKIRASQTPIKKEEIEADDSDLPEKNDYVSLIARAAEEELAFKGLDVPAQVENLLNKVPLKVHILHVGKQFKE